MSSEGETSLPISVIMPTAGRVERLLKTLGSLRDQNVSVREVLIAAANTPASVADNVARLFHARPTRVQFELARHVGAAAQRNQSYVSATQPYVLFMDDDVDLQRGCLSALWSVIQSDEGIGGVGVHILNQPYHSPGQMMRRVYASVGCPATGSLAGRCCGPGLNFLPARQQDGASHQQVDWLNSTCTLYRREALPPGPFPSFFVGYSLMEDVGLSVTVGRGWRLAIANQAAVLHDSKPQEYKSKSFQRQRMEVVNRYYIMTRCMGQKSVSDAARLAAYQAFILALSLRRASGWRTLPTRLAALAVAGWDIAIRQRSWDKFSQ